MAGNATVTFFLYVVALLQLHLISRHRVLVCGTLHLTEEEDGTPYLFSERFDCFSIYRHDHVVVDVEKHLNNYDALIHGFSSQLPRFEAELRSFVPVSNQRRALRFLRYALFMTHIEHQRCKPKTAEIRRDAVFLNEYDRLNRCSPALVSRFLEQTPSSIPLRRVFGQRSLLLAEGKSEEEATQLIYFAQYSSRRKVGFSGCASCDGFMSDAVRATG